MFENRGHPLCFPRRISPPLTKGAHRRKNGRPSYLRILSQISKPHSILMRHAQLPLIILLHQDNAFRSHRQSLKILSAQRPKIRVVQIHDLPSPQFITGHDILEYVTGTSPADCEQLDFVAFIHPIGRRCATTTDIQMRCGKPRF